MTIRERTNESRCIQRGCAGLNVVQYQKSKMTNAEKEALTQVIHDLIRQAVPKATTCPKYGGILYTLKPDEKEGQFCGVFVFKNHVHLAFANGAILDDPKGILQGDGKYRRHISIHDPDDLPDNEKAILKLLKQSAKKS